MAETEEEAAPVAMVGPEGNHGVLTVILPAVKWWQFWKPIAVMVPLTQRDMIFLYQTTHETMRRVGLQLED